MDLLLLDTPAAKTIKGYFDSEFPKLSGELKTHDQYSQEIYPLVSMYFKYHQTLRDQQLNSDIAHERSLNEIYKEMQSLYSEKEKSLYV